MKRNQREWAEVPLDTNTPHRACAGSVCELVPTVEDSLALRGSGGESVIYYYLYRGS